MDFYPTASSHSETLVKAGHDRAIAEHLPAFARRTIAGWKCITVLIVLSGVNVFGQVQRVSGTLVVAVPVREGLVACADKRAFNHSTLAYSDDLVKIHKVNSRTLFVATNTVGFLDPRTGKIGFNVFEITSSYLTRHAFAPEKQFWDGLRKEIRTQLLAYLRNQKLKDQPETDLANNRLLFNLVFYSISKDTARSYSLKVFYEKAATPIIYIPDVASEEVKTAKLSGKGKDVMDYLSRNPGLSRDPSILRFDQTKFDVQKTSAADAVGFAKMLFIVANTGVPEANVSAVHDCALLSYRNGFQWIDDSANPMINRPGD